MVGTTISHYKILEKIGQGGMGVYWTLDNPLCKFNELNRGLLRATTRQGKRREQETGRKEIFPSKSPFFAFKNWHFDLPHPGADFVCVSEKASLLSHNRNQSDARFKRLGLPRVYSPH